jgi:hypothetical protein
MHQTSTLALGGVKSIQKDPFSALQVESRKEAVGSSSISPFTGIFDDNDHDDPRFLKFDILRVPYTQIPTKKAKT